MLLLLLRNAMLNCLFGVLCFNGTGTAAIVLVRTKVSEQGTSDIIDVPKNVIEINEIKKYFQATKFDFIFLSQQ